MTTGATSTSDSGSLTSEADASTGAAGVTTGTGTGAGSGAVGTGGAATGGASGGTSTKEGASASESAATAAGSSLAVGTATASAVIVRPSVATFKNTVAAQQVNESSVQLAEGNYMIQNVATGEYITFKRFAGVTSSEVVNCVLFPESLAESVAVTFEANGAKFAGGGKCAAAQWNSDIGDYVIAMVSYACESSAAAGTEWVKFIWFLLPKAKASSISPSRFRSIPVEPAGLEERASTNGPYYIITADHITDQVTAALTGANISTFGGYLSIAISTWDTTDDFQLWTLTVA